MIWWYWIVLGLALAAIEIATPGGFFTIFFAVAALLVGLLGLFDAVEAAWLQWLLFSLFSVVSLALFRKPLLERMRQNEHAHEVDSLVGEVATALDAIAAGQHGRVELRGTTWTGRNVGGAAVTLRERCRVVAVRGLELDIRSE